MKRVPGIYPFPSPPLKGGGHNFPLNMHLRRSGKQGYGKMATGSTSPPGGDGDHGSSRR